MIPYVVKGKFKKLNNYIIIFTYFFYNIDFLNAKAECNKQSISIKYVHIKHPVFQNLCDGFI